MWDNMRKVCCPVSAVCQTNVGQHAHPVVAVARGGSYILTMSSLEQAMAQGTPLAFATVFGAGILTSLTPCVYPMIPITVSVFGAKQARSKGLAFLLATLYVLGIAVMYSTLGVLAAIGGWAAGNVLSSPWFVVPLSLFFAVMASSMFGLWEIRLPTWLQNRMAVVGGKGLLGAFSMGLVGGVLIAPCTGPVLAGILGYVATTRNMVMGGGLLFTYALGIGVLFWVIATFAVSLPKSGAWMEGVKSVLGVALLVAAAYYLQNVEIHLAQYTSGSWSFAALNAGLIAFGLLLGAIHLTFHQGRVKALRKTLGIALLAVGGFGLVNFALAPRSKLPWIHNDEPRAIALAKTQEKPVLIDFWTVSCLPCRIMEKEVLSHPAVMRELERYVLLKVDLDKDLDDNDGRTKDKYRQTMLPEVIVLDEGGREVARAGKVESVAAMLELLR
jgi:thiol:disulfide interchange protein DsbD